MSINTSINRVTLLGNICKDPEVWYSQDTPFANCTLATSEKWRDGKTGELKEKTEHSKLVFSGLLAAVVDEHIKKGSKLYVKGKLETRKWQNQQGQDQCTTEIKVFEMEILDCKQQGAPQQQAPQQKTPAQHGGCRQQAPAQQDFHQHQDYLSGSTNSFF